MSLYELEVVKIKDAKFIWRIDFIFFNSTDPEFRIYVHYYNHLASNPFRFTSFDQFKKERDILENYLLSKGENK